MSIQADIIGPLKDTFGKAQEVFVLLPQNAGQEMVAAASGLALSLKNTNKNVTLACPTPISNTAKSIPGSADITHNIGNRNLIISIKVDQRDSIDKVSYNLDESAKTFNLVVQPKKGESPLKKDAVSFTYSGAQADLVFLIGVNRFEDLGIFYEAEKALFSDSKTVCVSRFAANPFADFHLSDSQTTSLTELTWEMSQTLGLNLNAQAATAFLMGIDTATQNLQSPNVTATTFEAMAQLMRLGGLRQNVKPSVLSHPSQPVAPTAPPAAANQVVPQEWLTPKIFKSSDTPTSA